jgi:hypothetical protein
VPKVIFFQPIDVSQKDALLQFYRYCQSELLFEESPTFQNLFVIGQSKRLLAKKHSQLGRHLTTNYCESQYITLNAKFRVNKNAQVASDLLFGFEEKEPYLQRHFTNCFNAA